jgi:uncharacterized protein (TIRG00374 family)
MKSKLSTILKTAISLLLFYFLFRKMDFQQFGETLKNARLGIILGAFAALWIGHYFCVIRWRMLMRPLMPVFPMIRLFEIYCIGQFFNLAFPTAVGGDVVKMYYVGKQSRRYAESFAATFLDRDSGMLAMLLLACLGTLLLPMQVPGIPVNLIVWGSFAGFLAMNAVIFMPGLHRMFTRLLVRIHLGKTASRIDAISSAFQIMGKNPRVLFESFLISVFNQMLVFGITWMTAIGLRLDVSLLYCMVLVPIVTLVTMIPISFSGLGLREQSFVILFGAIGISSASSTALGLLGSIMVLLSAVPGGIIYIFFRNRGDLQTMSSMETEF